MIIVTLDGQVSFGDTPIVHADDLGMLYGEGIFETLLIRYGHICLLDQHLQRFAHSAHLMELPPPPILQYRHAIQKAICEFHALPHVPKEAFMRLIYSRSHSDNHPVGYVMIDALPHRIYQSRRKGVNAMTLSRGYSLEAATMPWLLCGAKTLSYAVNMAALRYAASCHIDEVIFMTTDQYVLEGARSTVILGKIDQGQYHLLTPPLSHPILAGITQQALFHQASKMGWACSYQALTYQDLCNAQDLWLCSSLTLLSRIRILDGRTLRPVCDDTLLWDILTQAITQSDSLSISM